MSKCSSESPYPSSLRTDELKKAGWKEHQTAEPTLHEVWGSCGFGLFSGLGLGQVWQGTSLRLFFDDLCCEITFSTVFAWSPASSVPLPLPGNA